MTENLDFSPQEWLEFTNQERRIILMSRKYNMTNEEIMANLCWPLDPMKEVTWRGHKARLMRKMAKIRMKRQKKRV
jgi:hypothetical protein